jgi:hypothetical protein
VPMKRKMHPKSLQNLRLWKKGERCNGAELGGGVPKGYKRFGTLLMEIFNEHPDIRKNMLLLLCGDALSKKRSRLSLEAAEIIMDRIEGKPKETIITDPPIETVAIDTLSPELRRDILKEELSKLNEELKCQEPEAKY